MRSQVGFRRICTRNEESGRNACMSRVLPPGRTGRPGGPLRGTARPNQFKLSGTAITVPASGTQNRPRRPERYPAWTRLYRRPRRRKVRSAPFPPAGENCARSLAPPLPRRPATLGSPWVPGVCHGRLTALISERQSRPRRPERYPAWTRHCRRPWRCRACRRLCRRRWR